MQASKLCNKCKKQLPRDAFYSPPSGERHVCKKCDQETARAYRRAHPDFTRQKDREYAQKNPQRRWATACLAGHRRRGYVTEIRTRELYQIALTTRACFICGSQLDWSLGTKGKMTKVSPTLDRLNNEKVIRKDNILILCYNCNATKRDRTFAEFIAYCASVAGKFYSHLEYPQLVHL